jgi:ABC-type glycerol-3-phosphate transport system substrate-binding protein
MITTSLNRRRFLQGAGAATLALPAGMAAARAAAPVTLEFWNPSSNTQIVPNIVKTFNNTIGKREGIVVNNRVVPSDNNYVKYTTAMTSSGSPDAVMTYDYTSVAAWAANNFIQPMDAFAKAVGVKQSDYFPFVWDLLHLNGHIWGLLQEFDVYLFYWNKNIHQGPPPQTIDELDALSARYTKFDTKGNLVQVGIIPWAVGGYAEWGAVWGASFYDQTAGKWTINTPANRRFLEWFLKYVHLLGGPTAASTLVNTTSVGYYGDVFTAGKAAFSLEGQWMTGILPQIAPKVNFALTQLPTSSYAPYGTAVTEGGNMFLLPTKAPHPREAAIFLTYMGSAPAVFQWVYQGGDLPPVKAVALGENEYGKLWTKRHFRDGPYIQALRAGHMVRPIPSPQLPLFDTEMGHAISAVIYKSKTPAQALADLDSKISTAVQQFKTTHPGWSGE